MLEQLQPLVDNGYIEGGEIITKCPLCHKLKCHVGIGETGKFIANCFGGKCGNKGVTILQAFNLPLDVLKEDVIQHLKEELFDGCEEGLPIAPPQRLHEVYSKWLQLCPLTEEDRASLHKRGLTDAQINTKDYGSWSGKLDVSKLPKGSLDNIPGCKPNRQGTTLDSSTYSGILIPCRNIKGQIVALKVRLHTPTVRGKMRVFSSHKEGGSKAIVPIHYPKGTPTPAGKVWITEGELKADIASALYTEVSFISVPGVGSVTGKASSLISTLKAMGVKSVGLAFDKDDAGKQATRCVIEKLAGTYGIALVQWDTDDKGIDDALNNNCKVTLTTGAEVLEQLEKPKLTTRVALWNALDLLNTEFPPIPFILPDIIPTGLSVLAGKSKIGKSFFLFDLCVSVATGTNFLGDIPLNSGKVLYLALEDTLRTLSKRLSKIVESANMTEDQRTMLRENLIVASSSSDVPRMPGGMQWLRERVLKNDGFKLVVIDTLERFRPTDSSGKDHNYSGDYALLTSFKEWAEEHQLGVVLVHHTRKNNRDSGDVFDSILGSTGLLGAADTLILLQRDRGSKNGKLMAAGREVQHIELPVRFEDELGRWVKLSDSTDTEEGGLTAEMFLTQLLGDGEAFLSKDVFQAGKALGFSVDMLKVAKKKLGNIEAIKTGTSWVWKMNVPKDDLKQRLQNRIAELDEKFRVAIEAEKYEEASELKREREKLEDDLSEL